jgi:hypothetical protein
MNDTPIISRRFYLEIRPKNIVAHYYTKCKNSYVSRHHLRSYAEQLHINNVLLQIKKYTPNLNVVFNENGSNLWYPI